MLLIFDVGNTNISLALYDGKEILNEWRIVTNSIRSSGDLNIILTELFNIGKINFSSIDEAIMGSVVTRMNKIIPDFCDKNKIKLMRLSDPNININFDSIVKNYRGVVGEDIICNIIAGKKKFKENFIIVDMGTAITFDIAGKDGFHIGEVFVPDINIAMESMIKKCSLLKNEYNKFKYQDFVIGKTTKEAINGGIFWGYIGLIDNIIRKIKEEVGNDMTVCLTGGISNIFLHHLPFIEHVDKDLTIKGLIEIWKNNRNPYSKFD